MNAIRGSHQDIERDCTLPAGNSCGVTGVKEDHLCGVITARFGSRQPHEEREVGLKKTERGARK